MVKAIYKILFFYLLLTNISVLGQNLVPNPGFEEHTNCPAGPSYPPPDQMSYSQSWSSYRQNPDYFNMCSTNPDVSPPNCFYGFQFPHKGNAYAGFVSYYGSNYREFIGAQLLSPIIAGQRYYITFYINLGGSNQDDIATNKMGIKFSTIPYSIANPAPIDNISHFYPNTIITDTMNWTRVSSYITADNNYSYIMIGNFFDNNNTDTINLSAFPHISYYYIDDICVTTDSLFNANWTGITEQTINKSENITRYPNPCTNELNVQFNNVPNEQTTLSIIDITGKAIMQTQTKENEYTFNTEKLAKGLYLVKVETGRTVATVKVNKE